jgi:hypothetical protein
MQRFLIKGNHPVLRYVTWIAEGTDDLNQRYKELQDAGYEIEIEVAPDVPPKKQLPVQVFQRPCIPPVITGDGPNIRACYNDLWIDFRNGQIIITPEPRTTARKRESE